MFLVPLFRKTKPRRTAMAAPWLPNSITSAPDRSFPFDLSPDRSFAFDPPDYGRSSESFRARKAVSPLCVLTRLSVLFLWVSPLFPVAMCRSDSATPSASRCCRFRLAPRWGCRRGNLCGGFSPRPEREILCLTPRARTARPEQQIPPKMSS